MEKIKEYLTLYWRLIIPIVILIILGGTFCYSKCGYHWDSQKSLINNQQISKGQPRNSSKPSAGQKICVDIKGAVNRPGVYHLMRGSRVEEAIVAAGGSNNNADLNQVNLAKELADQQVVKIPKVGEQLLQGSLNDTPLQNSKDKINLNNATKDDLTKIDGIGDKKADKIIEYRSQHGGFKSADDLKNINGFGEKTVAKLKDQISV